MQCSRDREWEIVWGKGKGKRGFGVWCLLLVLDGGGGVVEQREGESYITLDDTTLDVQCSTVQYSTVQYILPEFFQDDR